MQMLHTTMGRYARRMKLRQPMKRLDNIRIIYNAGVVCDHAIGHQLRQVERREKRKAMRRLHEEIVEGKEEKMKI